MAKIKIEKTVAQEILDKVTLLGKDTRMFFIMLPEVSDGQVAIAITVVNQPNQYTFGATIEAPEDFVKGECYMRFACDATRFANIVSNLLLFDCNINIAEMNGQYFIGGGNYSVVELETIAWPEDESSVFFDAKGEKIFAAIKDVEQKEFASALLIGGGFSGDGDKTKGVSLSFSKDRLVVSSTTGSIAGTARSEKLGKSEMGEEPTRVCVSDRQLDALKKFICLCGEGSSFSIQCGEKHIFLYANSGKLFLGLSVPGADADGLINSFTGEKPVGTLVFDTEQLSTTLKAYIGLSEEDAAIFKLDTAKNRMGIKARKCNTILNAPIASADGDLSVFPECLSVKFLRSALGVLKNGNLVISLYTRKGMPYSVPVLSNEKQNNAYNGEILIMPVQLDKLEASEKKIAEAEAKKKADKGKKATKSAKESEE